MNKLYFADCLDVLKELHSEHKEGFIDLIYIDPPFNSKRDYNILFESIDMNDTKAQKEAFADTWSNVSYIDTLNEIKSIDLDLYSFLNALDKIRISKSAISYLTTMAIRIYYMHKVLKDTGSFYLHCDPTMSHYLKLVCDLIFGERNFRSEITWQRTNTHNDAKKHLANVADIILYYTKSNKYIYNPQYTSLDPEYVRKFYRHDDNDGRGIYRISDLASPNPRPNLTYFYKGYEPPANGWAVSLEKMKELDAQNRIYYPKKEGGRLQRKKYLSESKGNLIGNIWLDIYPLSAQEKEKLGYPTQKPEALLERIIKTSSEEGDLVADFFCGCGTTIAAAQKLNRNWVGTDISHLAIKLIVDRLTKPYPKARAKVIKDNIYISGFPRDIAGAHELAENSTDGRFGFQEWIIEVMLGGIVNPKRTADGGWDGYITFDKAEKEKGVILIEVKSGNVNVKNVREFIHVVNHSDSADMGIFVCFENQVTKPMLLEAKNQGYFDEKHFGNRIDKIQIITVEDLLNGKEVYLPNHFYVKDTFKTATKKTDSEDKQESLF